MNVKSALRENFVLLVGLILPILLMTGFMLASNLSSTLVDPPKYDLVFSVEDYGSGAGSGAPVAVRLVVKDGVLVAQYTRIAAANNYHYWKKIYIYEAASKTLRQIPFGYPADVDSITQMREEVLTALQDKKLSTTLQAPDGYELSYDGYSHSGLVNELFWGHHSREPRLRKGNSSVRLANNEGGNSFYYGSLQFIGWVVP